MSIKQYKISAMGLQRVPEALVKLRFEGGIEVEARMNELSEAIKEAKMRSKMPVRAEIDGLKGGVFPCLIVQSDVAAAFLSAKVGYKVDSDDGVSFATQFAAYKVWDSIKTSGGPLEDIEFTYLAGPKVAANVAQLRLAIHEEEQLPF